MVGWMAVLFGNHDDGHAVFDTTAALVSLRSIVSGVGECIFYPDPLSISLLSPELDLVLYTPRGPLCGTSPCGALSVSLYKHSSVCAMPTHFTR